MCLLPSSLPWLLDSANPEAASLHSLAQSFRTAPTYLSWRQPRQYLLFPCRRQGWPVGTKATRVGQASSEQGGSKAVS